jgi:hypothetical protein
MIAFVLTYWSVVIPTTVVGAFLLGVLKKVRDEKANSEKSPVSIAVQRKSRS